MARTDHHRPYAVRCRDPYEYRTANHYHHPYGWWARTNHGADDSACTLDRWQNCRHHERGYRECAYCGHFMCTYDLGYRDRPYPHPPRWFTHDFWYGPERVRERDDLRALAREYNAHGEIEDADFPNDQHRHRGNWWWW